MLGLRGLLFMLADMFEIAEKNQGMIKGDASRNQGLNCDCVTRFESLETFISCCSLSLLHSFKMPTFCKTCPEQGRTLKPRSQAARDALTPAQQNKVAMQTKSSAMICKKCDTEGVVRDDEHKAAQKKVRSRTLCTTATDASSQATEYAAYIRAEGMISQTCRAKGCDEDPINANYCLKHRNEYNEQNQANRDARHEIGLCVKCTEPNDTDGKLCSTCITVSETPRAHLQQLSLLRRATRLPLPHLSDVTAMILRRLCASNLRPSDLGSVSRSRH